MTRPITPETRRKETRTAEERREYLRAWREAHPGYATEDGRKRRAQDPDNYREQQRQRRDDHREKFQARWTAYTAYRSGRIDQQPCAHEADDCRGKLQMHHADYSKPLEVTWLCRHHHALADRGRL